MSGEIKAQELNEALRQPHNLALIDVRETAEYNLAHIAGSCSVPRRLIEFRMRELVPFAGTDVIVCDDDGRRAALAAATIESMGYTNVHMLAGGLNRWVTDGLPTEWGVNVPSKDFGEKLLLQKGVPEIEADELFARQQRGDKLLILDSRTPEEHQRACIPGSRSMPGAELGLRVWDLIDDPDTTVIVHCAGRTRSIVGAGTLQRLGVKDVFALKNGTMGWQLAGLQLETGSPRVELPQPTPQSKERAESLARKVSVLDGVQSIGPNAVQLLKSVDAASRNLYLFDVRSREEYAVGHISGFRWVPGGQAVQATDNYVAVKDSTIVFACDGIVRASMTASWFCQMGYANVFVLEGGTAGWQKAGLPMEIGLAQEPPFGYNAASSRVPSIPAAEVALTMHAPGTALIFVGTSDQFCDAHLGGSAWVPRSWLELRIGDVAPDKDAPIIATCANGVESVLAAATLQDMGYTSVSALAGGVAGWRADGRPLETGLTGVMDAPNDVLPVRRSFAEMLNYLRWEEELGEKYRA